MSKSVYSLVLSDHIVKQLDLFAAHEGISRSNAVNRILAEHLSVTTPEQMMQNILERVERLLEPDELQLLPTLANGLLAVRTPVRFRYNPTVRCVVELQPDRHGTSGELRCAARTTSGQLTAALDDFFSCFAAMAQLSSDSCTLCCGRFSMRFLIPGANAGEAADTIAGWLRLMQSAMQGYFEQYPDLPRAHSSVAAAFRAAH